MKKLIVFICFMFSGMALGGDRIGEVSKDLKPLDSSGGACQIVFVTDNVVFFDAQDLAQNFCRGIYSNHGFRSGCIVRGHGNGFFEANFSFRGGFSGLNFGAVSNQYRDFITGRRLYQNGFQFRSQYFNCFD